MECDTGCSKSSSSEAAGESKPEAYPQGYVEDFDEPRTKLAGFFSIQLDRILENRLRPDGLSQDTPAFQFVEDACRGSVEIGGACENDVSVRRRFFFRFAHVYGDDGRGMHEGSDRL